jgi:hypothetical protein
MLRAEKEQESSCSFFSVRIAIEMELNGMSKYWAGLKASRLSIPRNDVNPVQGCVKIGLGTKFGFFFFLPPRQ